MTVGDFYARSSSLEVLTFIDTNAFVNNLASNGFNSLPVIHCGSFDAWILLS